VGLAKKHLKEKNHFLSKKIIIYVEEILDEAKNDKRMAIIGTEDDGDNIVSLD